MKLLLIYNPAAGRGRARRHAREVETELRSLGADVDVHASANPHDLTRAAAAGSRDRYDRVVIAGGDGTLNLAVRDFDLDRGTLAVVPLGSGDDFARVIGIPRAVRAACELVTCGTPREVDVASVNGLRYLGVAGVGFDSEVARFANDRVKLLRGSAVYLFAILRVIPSFAPRAMRINGHDEEVMFAAFSNSGQYGAGIRIAPQSLVDDGQLDVCIIHRTTRIELLKTLPLAYSGKHVRKSFVEMRRGSEFRVETNSAMDVFADGEPVTQTPATFRILEKKLKIVAAPHPAFGHPLPADAGRGLRNPSPRVRGEGARSADEGSIH